ncbi:MAG: hypothetical protein E7291_05195 [Lachnospiraceae bacterium]|nr:hypothetical protein [Lachnospiraceae bacterium]
MKKKPVIILSTIACLLVLAVFIVYIVMSEQKVITRLEMAQEVIVTEGVAEPQMDSQSFIVEEDGEYVYRLVWEAPQQGLITGINVVDAMGESIFACTAESASIESYGIEMQAGEYTIETHYITNQEALEVFGKSTGLEIIDEGYPFAEQGEWQMEYDFVLHDDGGYSNGWQAGIVFGVILGILIVVIMLAATKKGERVKCDYDERQEIVKGKGFQYGFFTVIICNAILIFLSVLKVTFLREMEAALFISVVLGVAVYVSYCIWNDGYFALNENRKSLIIIFATIGILNIAIGIRNIINGSFIRNGSLTFESINFFCGLLMLEILIVILLKKMRDGKEE